MPAKLCNVRERHASSFLFIYYCFIKLYQSSENDLKWRFYGLHKPVCVQSGTPIDDRLQHFAHFFGIRFSLFIFLVNFKSNFWLLPANLVWALTEPSTGFNFSLVFRVDAAQHGVTVCGLCKFLSRSSSNLTARKSWLTDFAASNEDRLVISSRNLNLQRGSRSIGESLFSRTGTFWSQ